ncbi:nucleoside-diphosphate sugar epimerase/dehydratase [Massilia sp. CFBP9012]|uniref:polysaccharide biosynthesis protein n=1 Tax=Massilia sp. CFBP9012 TaxID=3096531 RepID=UPI002A69DA2A|nr:nucleoside-diphosphate sugar epimerase/dehydratase [Massilia sp. CFBP9012]MDY0977114.1 nucleoside-diphosphate sugar epimerase/dehydratase [Massilia sp. CFBP9012]
MSIQRYSLSHQLCARIVSMHRTAKAALAIGVDLVALPVCFLIAMILRGGDLQLAKQFGPGSYLLVAVLTIMAFWLSDLYRAVIRFIDHRLLTLTGLALGIAVLCAYLTLVFLNEARFPRSALAIYWFIAFSYVVVSRIGVRKLLRSKRGPCAGKALAVAIYGAGEAGARLAQTMRDGDEYRPLCFFDDKHALNERTVAGLRVFHTSRLVELGAALGIRTIVIALPTAAPERLRELMQRLGQAGVPTKILTRLVDLADDKANDKSVLRDAIREIKFEDLLGRPPVPPRLDLFARCVRGQGVLVTGAGGSIGSELCRQIVTLSPARLHLVDHSEYALYTIRQELAARFPDLPIHAHLGSVCNADLVERVLAAGGIDTIYHAAAYKHVPLVETNIVEGLRNNVLGAQIIAAAAAHHGVQTCVLISSDKAVRPTNIMGASKRIAELIFQAAAARAAGGGAPGDGAGNGAGNREGNRAGTTFCMVRFGNVLGSSGSVIPLFQRQITRGGPVTITHPEVSRYFMLIPEAAQLVIQAGAMAKGGDVFVLDMGEPVRILDLARTMIAMYGLTERTPQQPRGDVEIEFIGLFPGEKLHEELLTDGTVFPSEHPRIMRMKESALRPSVLETCITCLMMACETHERGPIESMVKAIVSEYLPSTPVPLPQAPVEEPVPVGLIRKFVPFRI